MLLIIKKTIFNLILQSQGVDMTLPQFLWGQSVAERVSREPLHHSELYHMLSPIDIVHTKWLNLYYHPAGGYKRNSFCRGGEGPGLHFRRFLPPRCQWVLPSLFFQNLCDFVRDCNKRHIFSVCLFFLLTIAGRNKAKIEEIKHHLFWMALLWPFPGVPIIRFPRITKNGASSRL